MELSNEFRVPVPVEQAWDVLCDVEGIAPCMPGAQLEEVEGDEYRGIVKVKVGPITAQYKGAASFSERDVENRRLVLTASGRDTRGQGNASATVTAQLTPDGDGTRVVVDTDLTITGKVAQFGRGVLGDVSGKLIDQFVECLEGKIESGQLGSAAATASATEPPSDTETASATEPPSHTDTPPPTETPPPPETASATETGGGPTAASNGSDAGAAPEAPKVRRIEGPAAQPVDLVGAAGAPVLKRALPVILVVLLLLVLGRRRHR